MSYTSLAFALFVFLCFAVYYAVPKRFRYIVLLLFSYAFYIITCNKYIIYMLVTTVSTYFAGIYIDKAYSEQKEYLKLNKEKLTKEDKKAYKQKMKSKARLFMVTALLINFGILGFLKYADFCIANINLVKLHLFHSSSFIGFFDLVLPLGISFYTFQSMGYLIDLYYAKYSAEKNFLKIALYVSFFPQIVQGPISRFNELSQTLYEGADYDSRNLIYGSYQILWGLFKKLVIADRVAVYVSNCVSRSSELSGTYLLLAIFFYSMQIYGDFSGGIDITIGVARIFGIQLAANFERPFFSKSVAEYWRRWHITLGTWFKDYIFYPITVSKSVINLGKWCREHINEQVGKRVPIYFSMFGVWFLTGLWHGAQWRYIVWGLLNFVILTISTEAEGLYGKINRALRIEGTRFQKVWQVFRTFWIMSFLRVFDLAEGGVSQAVHMIIRSVTSFTLPSFEMIEQLGLDRQEFWAAIVGIVILFAFDLIQRRGSVRDMLMRSHIAIRWVLTALLVLAIVIYGSYGIGYDARSFIYLQF